MGCGACKCAEVEDNNTSSAKLASGPLVLHLASASRLPSHDLLSASDAFAVAEVYEPGAKRPTATARWPVKWDAADPLWESARQIGEKAPTQEAELVLKFFDHDTGSENDFIGKARCKIEALPTLPLEPLLELPIDTVKKAAGTGAVCMVARHQLPIGMPPARKTVYLVRHGESVWNKAQQDKDVLAMLSTTDHPLNEAGRQQAEGLCTRLNAEGDEEAAMRAVTTVWCSPLCRAVQTCLIGLQPLLLTGADPSPTPDPNFNPHSSASTDTHNNTNSNPSSTPDPDFNPNPTANADADNNTNSNPSPGPKSDPKPVLLNPNLREKRNLGGKDSSGKWSGEALRTGVHKSLDTLYPEDPLKRAALAAVPLDLHQVQNKWWLGSAEGKEHVQDRVNELLMQVRFAEAESVALVGHSHYFRELLRRFHAPDCTAADADGREMPISLLTTKKLSNAGVAKVELVFRAGANPTPPISSVQLLFGTTMV